jgi:pimeloyl-ACP methyl ester carboxylesterase
MTEPRWTHKYAETNGIRMHYVEQGQGYPVLLLHGFPELWYSWRHQIPALADAGFRALAPDLRGYGETDKPREIIEYDIHHLEADIVGLLDGLGIDRCAVVGHDWGSIIVWHLALSRPERFERIVSLNVPFTFARQSEIRPTERFKRATDGRFNYILAFQEEGVAEAAMDRDVRGTLDRMMRRIAAAPDFLSRDEMDVFVDAFERGGFRGPINYYRNFDRNWETTGHLRGRKVEQPTLMILADKDPILRPEGADGMEDYVPDLEKVYLQDCGHWTQQERHAEVTQAILAFLSSARV